MSRCPVLIETIPSPALSAFDHHVGAISSSLAHVFFERTSSSNTPRYFFGTPPLGNDCTPTGDDCTELQVFRDEGNFPTVEERQRTSSEDGNQREGPTITIAPGMLDGSRSATTDLPTSSLPAHSAGAGVRRKKQRLNHDGESAAGSSEEDATSTDRADHKTPSHPYRGPATDHAVPLACKPLPRVATKRRPTAPARWSPCASRRSASGARCKRIGGQRGELRSNTQPSLVSSCGAHADSGAANSDSAAALGPDTAASAATEEGSMPARPLRKAVSFSPAAKTHCGPAPHSVAFDALVGRFFTSSLGAPVPVPLPELPPVPGWSMPQLVAAEATAGDVIAALAAYAPPVPVAQAASAVISDPGLAGGCPRTLRTLLRLSEDLHSRLLASIAHDESVRAAAAAGAEGEHEETDGSEDECDAAALAEGTAGLGLAASGSLATAYAASIEDGDDELLDPVQAERAARAEAAALAYASKRLEPAAPVLPGGGGSCAKLGRAHLAWVRQLVFLLRHAALLVPMHPAAVGTEHCATH